MLRFVVGRVLWMVPVLWLVATVTFVLMHATPGSPWDAKNAAAGGRLNSSLKASFNRRYGLDKPLYRQYLLYLGRVARFDLGESFQYQGEGVVSRILQGFRYSARLGIYALCIAVLLGLPLGVVAALKQNTWADYLSLVIATVGYTIPSFVIGLFFIVLFAVKLKLLPVLWTDWRSYLLPSLVLGLGSAAFLARLTRASVLETKRQDYVRTARAKGLPARLVTTRHILRNSLLPVVTILGPALAELITGTIIIENVFGVPGMGYLFIQGIRARDYPMIMGSTLFYACCVALANLLVDLTYGFLDPRIKAGR
jgi:oligopeptide transport system permease protein